MTQTGYSNAIVGAMLSWLKGLATWVLRLFNLSSGMSPLKFLADNWLKLLVFFLILGVAMDLIVWLIRWRPHWVWFRKKRVIINDRNFFEKENSLELVDGRRAPAKGNRPARPKRNWEESEFVVPSSERRKREQQQRLEMERRKVRTARVKSMQIGPSKSGETVDVFTDGMFNVNAKQKFSDKYEDEVFSVKNLPRAQSGEGEAMRREAPAVRGETADRRSGGSQGARRAGNPPRAGKGGRGDMRRGQKRPATGRR